VSEERSVELRVSVDVGYRRHSVALTELRSGSRRSRLPAVRTKIVRGLVENYGVGVAEIARQVGIFTSGVSKILTRTLSS
jgi:putative transposase